MNTTTTTMNLTNLLVGQGGVAGPAGAAEGLAMDPAPVQPLLPQLQIPTAPAAAQTPGSFAAAMLTQADVALLAPAVAPTEALVTADTTVEDDEAMSQALREDLDQLLLNLPAQQPLLTPMPAPTLMPAPIGMMEEPLPLEDAGEALPATAASTLPGATPQQAEPLPAVAQALDPRAANQPRQAERAVAAPLVQAAPAEQDLAPVAVPGNKPAETAPVLQRAKAAAPAKAEPGLVKATPTATPAASFASVIAAIDPSASTTASPVLNLPAIALKAKAGNEGSQWQSPLLQALGDRIQLQIAARSEQAVIRLDPPQMGRVEIAILRQEAGPVEVRISASHGEVQRQLQQGSEGLRHDLVQRLGGEVSVQVAATAATRETAADARQSGSSSNQQQQRQQQAEADAKQGPGRALNASDEDAAATPFALA